MQYSLDAEETLIGGEGRMEKANEDNWIISIINDKWGKCGKSILSDSLETQNSEFIGELPFGI